jgi:hypothetical protein
MTTSNIALTLNTFNASTTFVNVSSDKEKESEFIQTARKHFAGVADTLEFYSENGRCKEDHMFAEYTRRELIEEFNGDREEVRSIEKVLSIFDDSGDFNDYGLSFDFVEADEDQDAFYRFQICWGGPSSEVRFHLDGSIEAVYMDWFVGVGFDVSSYSEFEWLLQDLTDCNMINFEDKEPEELYQFYHLESEEEEEGEY